MGRLSITRVVFVALVAIVAVAGWLTLGPAELGGPARYAIVDGTSMSPFLVDGDLAVVRAAGEPENGKVVLYHDPRLDVDVLHRVVRETGDRFVLKGDNNDYLDDARPSGDELGGTLWFSVPYVGSAIEWVRVPSHAAIVVFVLAVLAFAGGGAGAARSRRHPARALGITASGSHLDGALRGVVTAALIAASIFGVLALAAFSRSPVRTETVDEARVHRGALSYSASVEPSDVYPDGVVRTGESAFLELVPALDVAFAYRFQADDAEAVHGTASLDAVVSDGTGWVRRLEVAPPQEFTGLGVISRGTLDLEELSAIVQEMKSLTGSYTTTFSVRLEPEINTSGRVGSDRFADRFTPKLPFLLDDVALRVDAPEDGSPALSAREAENGTIDVPRDLALGSLRLSVEAARRHAVVGLAIALFLLFVGAVIFSSGRRDSEHARIASRFGDRLVTISRAHDVDPRRVTDLADFDGLARVAELHDRVILHWRRGEQHVYLVDDGSTAYRYHIGPSTGEPRNADLEDTLVLPG
jgi:signal peptidase I